MQGWQEYSIRVQVESQEGGQSAENFLDNVGMMVEEGH